MRFTYARLKGYIGIYNGLGLRELEIDFSSSKHRITVISGINGCGKSTLMNSLSILPDNSSNFVPGIQAEKELHIYDNGTVYRILITSPVAKSGRGVTKASIQKNGTELNPNGNISSYKEIIFSEFDMDANFITLSQLSSADRGLADKLPSERKKFMSSIIDTLEVYNDIYKNLNKKLSIFRSHINNLHSKISSIGDEGALRATLSTYNTKVIQLKNDLDCIKDSISKSKAKLEMNDPNGSIQDQYIEAEKSVSSAKDSMRISVVEFERHCVRLGILADFDKLLEFIKQTEDSIGIQSKTLEDLKGKKAIILSSLGKAKLDMDSKRIKLNSLSQGIDPELESKLQFVKTTVISSRKALREIGITHPDQTTKEEQSMILDTIRYITELIDSFYMDSNQEIYKHAINPNLPEIIKQYQEKLGSITDQISIENNKMERYKKDAEIIGILQHRPDKCKINDCPFISSAYQLSQTKYKDISVLDLLGEVSDHVVCLSEELDIIYNEILVMSSALEKQKILNQARDIIRRNRIILSKNEYGTRLIKEFEDRITSFRNLDSFKDLDSVIEGISILDVYQSNQKTLSVLETDWKIQSNNMIAVKQYESEISELTSEIESYEIELKRLNHSIQMSESILNNLQQKQSLASNAKVSGEKANEARLIYEDSVKSFERVKTASQNSIDLLNNLVFMNNELAKKTAELNDIEPRISSINGQLTMLESYKSEYNMYSAKYDLVDRIKRYTSPTTGGIQALFIDIYMSKTLDMANQILSMIFGGEYRLLDFVVNANEFRIPFIGSGLAVDDVSSGSTSQICIIGMVINMVLLHQASTRYNITRLDEIDGGLDSRNKIEFINVLYRILDILGIEQLFIISHSVELESSNVDIIRLRTYDNYDSLSSKGNVIYDFSTVPSKLT